MTRRPSTPFSRAAFSLVEVLVAVALVGILVFIALPNIVQVKDDSETHLAITRAEALNMGTASFIQARGLTAANATWQAAANDEARYTLIAPYLSFAPGTLAAFTPDGYGLTFPTSLSNLQKATLTKNGNELAY
jgi:prepilin-type N-terminal cleavage/methylation domain-containing protein